MEDASPDLKENTPKSTRRTHGRRGKHRGRRFGAGRKKGVPNKLNADVKAAIMEAFIDVGGAEYLRKVARSDPRTFCALLAKVLLAPVTDEPDGQPIISRIEMVIVDPKEQQMPTAEAAAQREALTQLRNRGEYARPAMRTPSF